MSAYGRIRLYCRLCPTKRHTPLPRSRSVVVEVTKIVNIDRPEVVVIDHVELVDPVLRGRIHPKPKPQLPTDSPSLAARAWPLTHCVSEQIVDVLRTDLPYKAGHGQPHDCTRADVQATQLGVRPLLTQVLLRPGVKANRRRPQLTGWRHRHPLGAGRCGGTTTTPVGLVVGNREQPRLRLVSLAGDDLLPRTRICGWFGMARRRGLAAYPLALLLHLVEANVSRHGTTSPHQQPLVGQPRCARSALAQVADRT